MENKIILQSTKWSVITEFITKIASPLVNIILARLLIPEVFGLVATFVVVTTFSEVFTDAGFQKYLIQHEFTDNEERDEFTNTAFWSNLIFSFIVWLLICAFSQKIALAVGSPGYGFEISVLCVQIPLYGFSSIQTALYKRDFRFKQLLPIRFVDSIIPLIITVPLAFFFRNCWSIIIGNVLRQFVHAALLSACSNWKPKFYYSFTQLHFMFKDCMWFLFDRVMIWLTSYSGVLILSHYLSSYYLGVYRTGISTITPYLNLIYTMTAPVLFSALSRLQTDRTKADLTFCTYQKYASYVVIPIGALIFTYKELVTSILLGSQWGEATLMIGSVGFALPFCILIAQYNSDYFRAMGKAYVAFTVQGTYLICMVLTLLWAVKQPFNILCIVTGAHYIIYSFISGIALYLVFKFDIFNTLINLLPPFIGAIAIFVVGFFLKDMYDAKILWQVLCGVFSLGLYLLCLLIIPNSRRDVIAIRSFRKLFKKG